MMARTANHHLKARQLVMDERTRTPAAVEASFPHDTYRVRYADGTTDLVDGKHLRPIRKNPASKGRDLRGGRPGLVYLRVAEPCAWCGQMATYATKGDNGKAAEPICGRCGGYKVPIRKNPSRKSTKAKRESWREAEASRLSKATGWPQEATPRRTIKRLSAQLRPKDSIGDRRGEVYGGAQRPFPALSQRWIGEERLKATKALPKLRLPNPSRKATKGGTIEDDTPILPWVVADSVVGEMERYLEVDIPDRDALVTGLADQAERIYKANADFAKKIRGRGNTGRDKLYSFMRHWLEADVRKKHPALAKKLPRLGYAFVGEPLTPRAKNPSRLPNVSLHTSPGALGTIEKINTGGRSGMRASIPGPRGGLVYVHWDGGIGHEGVFRADLVLVSTGKSLKSARVGMRVRFQPNPAALMLYRNPGKPYGKSVCTVCLKGYQPKGAEEVCKACTARAMKCPDCGKRECAPSCRSKRISSGWAKNPSMWATDKAGALVAVKKHGQPLSKAQLTYRDVGRTTAGDAAVALGILEARGWTIVGKGVKHAYPPGTSSKDAGQRYRITSKNVEAQVRGAKTWSTVATLSIDAALMRLGA